MQVIIPQNSPEFIRKALMINVREAIIEDAASEDPCQKLFRDLISGTLIAKQDGLLCGTYWAEATFLTLAKEFNAELDLKWHKKEGAEFKNGDVLLEVHGRANCILAAERTAINFLQTLSGTATTTKQFVTEAKKYGITVRDTRKTIPFLRVGQKYAVTVGGGVNHRMNLSTELLLKENHITLANGVPNAIKLLNDNLPSLKLQVEVESIEQAEQAIDSGAKSIMLDDMNLNDIQFVIQNYSDKVQIEISGGVDICTLEQLAKAGVKQVAVGLITKNVEAVDLSLRLNND